jgi:hypothetical protein
MFWAFVAALVAVPVGVFLLRPRVSSLFGKDFQGIKTEGFTGPILTLTVFMTAFVLAQATQTYQRANQSASNEASAIALLYENAGMLPDDRGQALQATSICYARAVKHLEWPAMAEFGSSDTVTYWADQFTDEIPKILDGPGAIVGQVVSLSRSQSEARLVRLNEASPNLPILTLVLMIAAVIGAVLLLTSFAIPDMRRNVLLVLATAMAALLGGTLYVIETLEEPFSGLIRVKPAVISRVADDIELNFAYNYPDATLPCTDEGLLADA